MVGELFSWLMLTRATLSVFDYAANINSCWVLLLATVLRCLFDTLTFDGFVSLVDAVVALLRGYNLALAAPFLPPPRLLRRC